MHKFVSFRNEARQNVNATKIMGTKVELHQLIDLSVDIHEGRSNVNFTYLNRILHELVKHLGIGSTTVSFYFLIS